jgi:hypothetical protein
MWFFKFPNISDVSKLSKYIGCVQRASVTQHRPQLQKTSNYLSFLELGGGVTLHFFTTVFL